MATHVLFDRPTASRRSAVSRQTASAAVQRPIALRRERGYVAQDGETYVEPQKALTGMQGLASAVMLELLAASGAGCAYLLWLWFR